jgi:hypothetical protein
VTVAEEVVWSGEAVAWCPVARDRRVSGMKEKQATCANCRLWSQLSCAFSSTAKRLPETYRSEDATLRLCEPAGCAALGADRFGGGAVKPPGKCEARAIHHHAAPRRNVADPLGFSRVQKGVKPEVVCGKRIVACDRTKRR